MSEEFVEIRHMVKSFRVAELQELLGYANRSKTGRKHHLMGRALEMLKSDPGPKVRSKIRELYGNRYPRRMYVAPYMQRQNNYGSSGYSMGESSHSMSTISSQGSVQPSSSTSLPVLPDVKLRPLPFYDFRDVLVRPHSLVPTGKHSRYQDSYILFHLSPQQVNEIVSSKDTRPMSNSEFNVQIQLRFCLLETSCEQDDLYPHSATLKVNGKMCGLPGFIPRDNKGEHKKCGRPVDITSYCRLSSTIPNHLHITWEPDPLQRFVVSVHLVRRVTSSCLIQRLKIRGRRNPDHSRALIKEKLTQDPDSEVATTSLRCSLLCPLGKTRMTLPCRSKNCNHLQCFDAALYLQMNERKSRWICPVCDQEARFNDLIIDGLFMEILEMSTQNNDIVFFEDGSWESIGTTDLAAKMTVITSPKVKVEKPKLIEEEDKAKSKQDPPVIDLTLSSDEEEEEEENHKTSPMIQTIPVLTRHPAVSSQTIYHPADLYPMGSPSPVLPDLGCDINLFTLPAESFAFYNVGGMRGQNAAHAINLD
ncbi:E3 SUMO-protein ligase PIAS2-like [Dendronephthya gigantea]|uniref:E3 SUMO-protein ligase PIAS2-like n=1 Tax=Dendronephthya gigantea TaxID=151771 RepID=UPI00106CAB37|nr:E3 SUMO-protein ligase PIAS2-like [Dendronephthya gigantea]